MARIFKRLLVASGMTCVLVGSTMAGTASASHLQCGDVITEDTRLDSDIGPCDGPGLIVGADNITLDLRGYTISGDGDGDAPGILVEDRQGVVVTNGGVERFGAGVLISGGSGNTVSKIEAIDNVGDGDIGDGILLDNSTGNLLSKNVARGNGPYGGITLLGRGSSFNTIEKNLVEFNNILSGPNGPQQDDGIRLENFANNNLISKNSVYDNGLDGIALFADTFNNVVEKNDIRRNGAHDQVHRQGDGIAVFNRSTGNLIEKNTVYDNGANGIFLRGPIVRPNGSIIVGATNNQVLNNKTGNNGPIPGPGGARYDLRDNNPACDANRWYGNTYVTAFPECTTIGGHQTSTGPSASAKASAKSAAATEPEVGATSSRKG